MLLGSVILFKRELAIMLGDYISKVRIDKAKALLRDRKLSMAQVALEAGFVDQSHFTEVFKKIEKSIPQTFRQNTFQPSALNKKLLEWSLS